MIPTAAIPGFTSAPGFVPPPALPAPADDARRTFSEMLSSARFSGEGSQAERARRGAEGLVAQALVLPFLKQVRASNAAAPPFAPTQGERAFGSLMDQAMAQHLVTSGRWALVDAVSQRMLRRSAGPGETP